MINKIKRFLGLSSYKCDFCKKRMSADYTDQNCSNFHSCKRCDVVYWENTKNIIFFKEYNDIFINNKKYIIYYNVGENIYTIIINYYDNNRINIPYFNINNLSKEDFVRKIKTYLIFQ